MDRMRVRLGLLMVLVLLAGPGLAHAGPSLDQSPAVTHEAGFLERAWSWMISAFEKFGSFIDPNGDGGQSIGNPPASPNGPGTMLPDAGSFIDPNGGS